MRCNTLQTRYDPNRPHVLVAGEGGVWLAGLQALTANIYVDLVPVRTLPLSSRVLSAPGLRGVIYISVGTGPCPALAESLVRVWQQTGLPQAVLCEQLEGLFSRFHGVEVVPLYASLPDRLATVNRVMKGAPLSVSPERQVRPLLPVSLLQVLRWRHQGMSMVEMAAQWQVSVPTAYARYARYRLQAGLVTPAEYAAVFGMAGTLLRLCGVEL